MGTPMASWTALAMAAAAGVTPLSPMPLLRSGCAGSSLERVRSLPSISGTSGAVGTW